MHYDFKGKNALVTGSSKGIGRAVAIALAQGGANVTINCSSSRDQAEEVAKEIRGLGSRAIVVACDVSNQQAVEAMVATTVAEFGGLDIFVSNAVYSDRQLMVDADMAGFRKTIEVSMWGALYGVRASAQQMLKQGRGGAITVVSSPHAIIPIPTAMAYNMAKAAIDHMARTAAIELVKYGIRVNVFHPGWIDTPGERKLATAAEIEAGAKRIPWGRLGTPGDIGRAAVFLASDDADYITGSALRIDGGFTLGMRMPHQS